MIQAISSPSVRVRIRVRAARLRNHRGKLGVAQAGDARSRSPGNRNENTRAGPAPRSHHVVPAASYCPAAAVADRAEDPRADDGADRQHDEVAGSEHALERPAASRAR